MVEGARLEIVWAFTRLGGSNPLASAKITEVKRLLLIKITLGFECYFRFYSKIYSISDGNPRFCEVVFIILSSYCFLLGCQFIKASKLAFLLRSYEVCFRQKN